MIKTYMKIASIQAERFDGSLKMANKYHLFEETEDSDGICWQIQTLEGWLDISTGDWIATGVNGEHWPIADDVFRQTYKEVPHAL